jgi:hypothetical protein
MANYLGNLLVTLSATKYNIMDKLPSQQYVLTFILNFDEDILAFFSFATALATLKMANYLVNLLVTLTATNYKIMVKFPDNICFDFYTQL